ncbi:hypothetical protein [Novosphingobium resinovorum]|uniref:hypothetical protein n=1 Tax=Novosphingobium resinovorum TaxID=158500 RepID=UPI002ED5B365
MTLKLNSLNKDDLAAFEGKGAADFCNTGLTTADQNHCAHFVCHALGFDKATPLCGDMKWATRKTGVTMRVDGLFNYCTVTGVFDDPKTVPTDMVGKTAFLVVATLSSNMSETGGTLFLGSSPKKHVGIYVDGSVWNFSNGRHKVVKDTVEKFFSKMTSNYGKSTKFYYAYRQDI